MTGTRSSEFSAAFARLTEPLAHLLITQGMTIAEATELLKQALMAAALEQAGQDATDSSLSLMTGLHRKDVKRLRAQNPEPPKRQQVNAVALLIAHWTNAPDFKGADGTPRVLPRKGDAGNPGFDALVRKARIDLPPATLIEKLSQDGLIRIDPETGAVALLKTAYVANPGSPGQLHALERNLTAHLSSAVENYTAPDAPEHFERALHVNQLSPASVTRLDSEARQAAEELLTKLTSLALSLQEADAVDDSASERFSLGAYTYAPSNQKDVS